ncbi:MAG: phosphatidate cytidylyltransferase [Deltaproteobacteria bacterium]|nr:phosphatidate cytidylyltransferase [Deltaproteobacteria bacterium]
MGFPQSSHLQRFFTASILIPALFAYIFWGGPALFVLLTWAGVLLGSQEYSRLTQGRSEAPLFVFYAVLGSVALCGAFLYGLSGLLAGIELNFLVWAVYRIVTFKDPEPFFERSGKELFGLLYLSLFMPFFVLIRMAPQGMIWVFFLLAVNYAGDTAAYYAGRTWGRHKLAPEVSPKKTWEGSLGGLVANGLIAWIFQQTLFPHLAAIELIGLGALLGVLSQFGDLTESLIKRSAGFKDSGGLFPGHGGFLDRVDSLLLPAPLLYFYLRTWLVGS